MTGRFGFDPWVEDAETAQISVDSQQRRWPEMEFSIEAERPAPKRTTDQKKDSA